MLTNHYILCRLTPDAEKVVPRRLIKHPIFLFKKIPLLFLTLNGNRFDLARHHDEGGGEPVLLEHLALGADEGEVEAHRRGWSQVLLPESNIADLSLTYIAGQYLSLIGQFPSDGRN